MKGQTAHLSTMLYGTLLSLEKQVGFELTITSGYRTPAHNVAVGGVLDSEHTHSPADGADILCKRGATRYKLVKAAFALGVTRIGIGEDFIHIGVSTMHPQEVVWHYYTPKPAPPPIPKEV